MTKVYVLMEYDNCDGSTSVAGVYNSKKLAESVQKRAEDGTRDYLEYAVHEWEVEGETEPKQERQHMAIIVDSEQHLLSLTPDQIRFFFWLKDNGALNGDTYMDEFPDTTFLEV